MRERLFVFRPGIPAPWRRLVMRGRRRDRWNARTRSSVNYSIFRRDNTSRRAFWLFAKLACTIVQAHCTLWNKPAACAILC